MLLQENLVVADRFRLVRIIGQGGMGSVWQAVHIALEQPCAVKFIEGEILNVADAHARFEREAKAAAQLRSPHVVQILDHGVWQGRPYIAMELLEGEDLGKTMARAGGKLHPSLLNTIVQQVCRALTKAHQAGIVHRDLKPDNIFLVTDDDRQIVKILDFGVAKQTSQAIEGNNTKTGAMLGTPYYMSPEQAQGIKSVDSRSDLWALAVIVYQCLTGERPFDSNALGDLLVKIIVQPVPIPSQVASVPPEFDRWWAKAAERNPDRRYQSAKEFATSLAVALGVTADGMETTRQLAQPKPSLRGTAMMQQKSVPPGGPNAGAATNSPNAAQPPPPAQQQQQAAFITTPQPNNQTPDGMVMGRYPSPSPQQQTPNPQQPNVLGSSGNPVTFSGVEPGITIPKRTPPPVVLAGMGAVLLIGIILISIVVVRRSSSTTSSSNARSGTATTATTSTADQPTASATTPVASTTTTTTAEAPSASVVATTEPKAPPPATTAAAATPTNTTAAVAKTATATTPTKPTASASAKRPPSMDDRKW